VAGALDGGHWGRERAPWGKKHGAKKIGDGVGGGGSAVLFSKNAQHRRGGSLRTGRRRVGICWQACLGNGCISFNSRSELRGEDWLCWRDDRR